MSNEKTHYRKAFNSPYLSSADIVEPMTFTIKSVSLDLDKTKKTKELFNTIYWQEKHIRPGEELKPMILNATNSKTLKSLTGSPFIEDWAGTAITVYVDPSVRFGKDTVEGLRVSTERPNLIKPSLTKGTEVWDRAVAYYQKTQKLDKVKQNYSVSEELEAELIALATAPVEVPKLELKPDTVEFKQAVKTYRETQSLDKIRQFMTVSEDVAVMVFDAAADPEFSVA
jgi:hypothetical protein